ncbi:MAG: peptidylprolyl isomerase, partial [Bacteroidetes bacterium]|nr:peptidylprolyl isomerase [Bacteroidota bacterium]
AEIKPGLFHKKGALGAARDGNPAKASSGSQFYIVQGQVFTDQDLDMIAQRSGKTISKEQREVYKTIGGTPHLDGDYTVFGEVYEGLDVVDKIASVKIGRNDRPLIDIKMTVTVIE